MIEKLYHGSHKFTQTLLINVNNSKIGPNKCPHLTEKVGDWKVDSYIFSAITVMWWSCCGWQVVWGLVVECRWCGGGVMDDKWYGDYVVSGRWCVGRVVL